MNVETAKEMLVDEIKNTSYTNGDPFGNAGSYRKVLEYLYQCVNSSLSPCDIEDWVCEIYRPHQKEEEHRVFKDRVNVLVTALNDLKNQGKLN